MRHFYFPRASEQRHPHTCFLTHGHTFPHKHLLCGPLWVNRCCAEDKTATSGKKQLHLISLTPYPPVRYASVRHSKRNTRVCVGVGAIDEIHQLEISLAFLHSSVLYLSNPVLFISLLCFFITPSFPLHHLVICSPSSFPAICSFSNHSAPLEASHFLSSASLPAVIYF